MRSRGGCASGVRLAFLAVEDANAGATGWAAIGAAVLLASLWPPFRGLTLVAGAVTVVGGFYARLHPASRWLSWTAILTGTAAVAISLMWMSTL